MVEQFACNVSKQVLFLAEMDEFIDISGLPERNVYGSVRCRGNVTKHKRAFKFITCLSAPDERNRLYFQLCAVAIAVSFFSRLMVKEDDGILKRQSLLTVRVYSHGQGQKRYLHTKRSKQNLFGKFFQYYDLVLNKTSNDNRML